MQYVLAYSHFCIQGDRGIIANVGLNDLLGVFAQPRPIADELVVGVVSASAVPGVFSEERNVQENETREKTGKEHDAYLETVVLRSVECDRRKSKYANNTANNPN